MSTALESIGIDDDTGLDEEIVAHVRTHRGPDADAILHGLAAAERTACFVIGFRRNARDVYLHDPHSPAGNSQVTVHDVFDDGGLSRRTTVWEGPVQDWQKRAWPPLEFVAPAYR